MNRSPSVHIFVLLKTMCTFSPHSVPVHCSWLMAYIEGRLKRSDSTYRCEESLRALRDKVCEDFRLHWTNRRYWPKEPSQRSWCSRWAEQICCTDVDQSWPPSWWLFHSKCSSDHSNRCRSLTVTVTVTVWPSEWPTGPPTDQLTRGLTCGEWDQTQSILASGLLENLNIEFTIDIRLTYSLNLTLLSNWSLLFGRKYLVTISSWAAFSNLRNKRSSGELDDEREDSSSGPFQLMVSLSECGRYRLERAGSRPPRLIPPGGGGSLVWETTRSGNRHFWRSSSQTLSILMRSMFA